MYTYPGDLGRALVITAVIIWGFGLAIGLAIGYYFL